MALETTNKDELKNIKKFVKKVRTLGDFDQQMVSVFAHGLETGQRLGRKE